MLSNGKKSRIQLAYGYLSVDSSNPLLLALPLRLQEVASASESIKPTPKNKNPPSGGLFGGADSY